MKVQKLVLVVWPDGAWYASDDLPPAASKPVAKGRWFKRRNGSVVAESDERDGEQEQALCCAVIECVQAMGYSR